MFAKGLGLGTSVPQVSQGMWVCVCVTGSPWCVGRGHRAEWQAGSVPHLRSNLPHPLRPTGRPDWSPTVRCGGHKPAGGGAEREREEIHDLSTNERRDRVGAGPSYRAVGGSWQGAGSSRGPAHSGQRLQRGRLPGPRLRRLLW